MSDGKKFCLMMAECECGENSGNNGSRPDYSLTEQYAGYHDYDGSKVYMKTIELGAMPNKTVKLVPHGISSLKKVLHDEWTWGGNGGWYIGNRHSAATVIEYTLDSVRIGSSADVSTAQGVVTLYYTCTDR